MAELKTYTVTEPWLKTECKLGEAPFWEKKSNSLRFVDIIKSQLHTVDLNVGPSSHKIIDLDVSIGTTGDIAGSDEAFIFGGKHGIGIFDKKTSNYKYIQKFWNEDEIKAGKENRLRANDGAIDTQGRYWVTTMNDGLVTDPSDEGVVFRFDPDLSLHKMIEKVTIPNGISWSFDDKIMYYTESPEKTIYAYDFDAKSGSISNKREFFKVTDEDGVPDGHAQDAEGCLWVAIHSCWKVVRVSPEGKIIAEIRLPTRCPTCPGFAGEDLYITSAEEEEPEKYPESVKLAGSTFKVSVGIKGAPLNRFKYQQD